MLIVVIHLNVVVDERSLDCESKLLKGRDPKPNVRREVREYEREKQGETSSRVY